VQLQARLTTRRNIDRKEHRVKEPARKLTVRRETLRTISTERLEHVAGGDTGSLSCGGMDCEPANKVFDYQEPDWVDN
jgi:hypothetical protein